ncbi:hypothetical protein HF888_05580 [Bermanella marisrubri]|uniref:Uncharacterized protein n=1 Tax=Bermanella marisrubri TaxID=207949 RepID=Q1MY77_9GAMM|nr:hypothetical protein [Bermanella marisrubri]EAT10933.1 hypothetical protein RED65_02398 [Oceanobacter sp. RED65] [Bermanella marisrubri]QIZ83724.1 hypothetical protein HF888_05580 [Bermanella marisrubri]
MTAIASLLGHGLLLMAVILYIIQARRWGKWFPYAYIIAAVVIVLPLENWLVVEFSRGYLSDLSMATVAIAVMSIVGQGQYQMSNAFKLTFLLLAIVLYPSAMGWGMFDVYSLGYPSDTGYGYLVAVVAAIAVLAVIVKSWQLAIVMTMVLIGNGVGLYETQNLWNYLLDPLVVVACIFSYLSKWVAHAFNILIKKVRYVQANA